MAKRHGPPLQPGESTIKDKATGNKGDLRFSLRLGEVTRVDYERMVCDIQWLQGRSSVAREVPISSAFWSPRGFLGGMPEEGSIAVCGFSAVHEEHGVTPYILSFITSGTLTAKRFDPLGVAERDADEISDTPTETIQKELDGIYGPTRHKMRKLYPGDVYGASSKGAEMLLDRDARLFDSHGGEIWLRAEDQSSIITTLDYYRSTGASRKRSGRIVRNALTFPEDIEIGTDGTITPDSPVFEALLNAGIIFEDGSFAPDVNSIPYKTLESGERQSIVTENYVDPIESEAKAFTEDRIEIQEFSDQQIPQDQGYDSDLLSEEDHFSPFIEKVTGTVVGNDPYNPEGRSNYGKVLKPVIFNSPNSVTGQPRLEQVDNSEKSREKNLAGAHLYRMRRPDGLGQLFVSHDKEGHCFISIPASTSKKSNLGGGRSIEADIKGSTKAVMGANQNDNVSFDVNAKGGFKWSLGAMASTKRSLDLKTQGGIALRVEGTDADGYSKKEELQGDVGQAIDGNLGTSVANDHIEEAQGKREISAESISVRAGIGDMNVNVIGKKDTTIQGSHTESIGAGEKKTILKPSNRSANAQETTIKLGNRRTTFAAPATDTLKFQSAGTKTVESTGALSCSWKSPGAGNYSFNASSGSFAVSMGSGSISMTTGGGAVSITSGASIEMQAPTIGIKGNVGLGTGQSATNAAIGGVPGPSPHLDYITGLPLRGNPLVRVP